MTLKTVWSASCWEFPAREPATCSPPRPSPSWQPIRKPRGCAWDACWISTPPLPSLKASLTEALSRGEASQTGDILISINGTTINNYGDMLDATYYLTGEKPLTVEVIRGTQVVKSRGIIPTQDSR